jgi:hypothetical protein
METGNQKSRLKSHYPQGVAGNANFPKRKNPKKTPTKKNKIIINIKCKKNT